MSPETGRGRVLPAAWGYFARSFLPADVVNEKPRYWRMETGISSEDLPLGRCVIPAFVPLKRFRGTKHIIDLTWFHLKRFLGTKCLMKCTWYRLKRFRGTK